MVDPPNIFNVLIPGHCIKSFKEDLMDQSFEKKLSSQCNNISKLSIYLYFLALTN